MTNTPHPGEPAQPAPQPSGTKFWDDISSTGLRRDRSRQWFAGVAAGIARRVDVDPILIRAAFVALTLFGGIGIPLYLVAWLLMPDDSGRIMAREALGGGGSTNGSASSTTGAVVLLIVTALAVTAIVFGGDGWFIGWGIIPLAIIGWLFWRHQQGEGSSQWTTTDQAPYAGGAPYAGTTGSAGAAGAPGTDPTSSTGPAPASASVAQATPASPSLPAAPYTASGPYAASAQPASPAGTAAHTASMPYAATPQSAQAPQSAQHGPAAPPVPPRAHVPLAPPPPPRPRRRSAGFSGFVLTLGMGVMGYAAGYLLADPVGFPGSAELLGIIIGLGAAALTTMIMGLFGRRSLLSAALVGILAISAVGAGVGEQVWDGEQGIRTWTPALSSTTTTYRHGAGETTLDLRPLVDSLADPGDRPGSSPNPTPSATPSISPTPGITPTPGASASPSTSPTALPAPTVTVTESVSIAEPAVPQRIEVRQGAGELTIIVPEGANAEIRGKASFGEVDVRGNLPDGHSDRRDGTNDGPSETRTLTLGSGAPTLIVNAELTFGQIIIQEG